MTYISKDGRPITEGDIERAVAEAEAGYDIDIVHGRGRPALGEEPSAIVTFRADPGFLRAFDDAAAKKKLTRSQAVRAAMQAWAEAS